MIKLEARTDTPALLAIVGPTTSGKSQLALALAERLDGEIVVADSRQVYRGMSIGTAKPTPAEQARVSHHLLDLVNPDQRFTVAEWLTAALQVVREVGERGRLPIVVGGTGLYVRALLHGYSLTDAPRPPTVRRSLEHDLEREGLAAMAQRLRIADRETAERTDLRNPRRVVAALERISVGAAVPSARPLSGPTLQLAADWSRPALYARIDARTAWMFEHGILAEASSLLGAGYTRYLASMSGHGYAEALAHLHGECSLEEAVARAAQRTRQYAKRQLSWFRADPGVVWLAAAEHGDRGGLPPGVLEAALAAIRVHLPAPRGASARMS